MSLRDKKLVEAFYTSGIIRNTEAIKEYIHPEAELYWNSSMGFNKFGYQKILDLSTELSKSFESLRADISHLLNDKNEVAIRFTYYARTIENPDEEIPLAHFIVIWSIKDGKMFKGYQISQPADETPENLSSFLSTNF